VATSLEADDEKTSYALGLRYGQNLKREGVEIDWSAFLTGMQHKLNDEELLLTTQEIVEMNREIHTARIKKRREEERMANERNIAFLEENKTKPGVKTTDSGLQYKVLEQGDGPKPGPNDQVLVHYIGELIDGTEFDNSYTRQKPIKFRLNQVIKGWSEGLQLMPVGSRYKLYIPSELGYGTRNSVKIPANSTLIFEVELLEIVNAGSEQE